MTTTNDKTCNTCATTKPRDIAHFRSAPSNADRLSGRCRSCDSAKAKSYYAANREKCIERQRAWNAANVERRRVYQAACADARPPKTYVEADRFKSASRRESEKRRRRASHGEQAMRRLEKRTIEALGGRPTPIRALIGCTPLELKAHLESKFLPGMSWGNRGQWHMDHIRPLSSFDLADPEQRQAACHYTNVQPLWAGEHMAKTRSDRCSVHWVCVRSR